MSTEVLYTSESIRKAIRDVLGKGVGRRVAVVAFIGRGAEAYLPNPRGLELYCWPAVPGTNPSALRKLSGQLGVSVHFSPRLHMKLYWSSRKGAVVTSANLSSNAYGHGDLKEFGVRLPAGTIDIDRVIASLDATEMSEASLRDLELAHAKDRAERRQVGQTRQHAVTFADWYAERGKKDLWRLATFDWANIGESRTLHDAASLAPREHFAEYMNYESKDRAARDDYLLCVADPFHTRGQTSWMFVSHRVIVARNDPTYVRDHPIQIGQEHPLRMYRRPPFEIDRKFRRAISATAKAFAKSGLEREFNLDLTVKPSKRLLHSLNAHYLKD